MTQAEREQLKQRLETKVAKPGKCLDLNTPFHWVSEDVEDPTAFFKYLPALIPADSILYFEGTSIAPDVAAVYDQNGSRLKAPVACDTIWPIPDIYHVAFSSEVCARLVELSMRHASPELFDHIKAYRENILLFTFHDAFCGSLRIAEHVPESVVTVFFASLGASFHKEQTQPRDAESLRHLVKAIRRDRRLRFPWQPALKRLWKRWTGR